MGNSAPSKTCEEHQTTRPKKEEDPSKPEYYTDRIPRDFVPCDAVGCKKKNATVSCRRCLSQYYCSDACKSKHWDESHHQECKLAEVISERANSVEEEEGERADETSESGTQLHGDDTAAHRPMTSPPDTTGTCGICLEDSIRSPAMLDCGHAFCFACISRYQAMVDLRNQSSSSSSACNVATCPYCRSKMPNLKSGTRSNIILHLTRAKNEKEDQGAADDAKVVPEVAPAANIENDDDDDVSDIPVDGNIDIDLDSIPFHASKSPRVIDDYLPPREDLPNEHYVKAWDEIQLFCKTYSGAIGDAEGEGLEEDLFGAEDWFLMHMVTSTLASAAGDYEKARKALIDARQYALESLQRKTAFERLTEEYNEIKSREEAEDSDYEHIREGLNKLQGAGPLASDKLLIVTTLQLASIEEKFGRYARAAGWYEWLLRTSTAKHQNLKMITSQYLECFFGASRSLYHTGEYERSILLGSTLVEAERRLPGIHKYIALSYQKLGQTRIARETAGLAVLYETPWDVDTKKSNYELWLSLAKKRDPEAP